MRFIYDLLFIIFAIFYVPYLFLQGKWHTGFFARLGSCPEELEIKLKGKKNIWIHAVSVGEVLAVRGLVKKLQDAYPKSQIVLSTVTQTGYKLASSQLKDVVVFYAPLDFSVIVRKYIELVRPEIYISTETEIWPNIFLALHENNTKIVVVNGRISDKSFERYRRIRVLISPILQYVSKFCMQSVIDAKRIVELGADKKKVDVTGNMKFDDVPAVSDMTASDLGFDKDDIIFIAGSTHPGEEEILLGVYKIIREGFPNFRIVLAPRHIERVNDIISLISEKGFEGVKFTRIKETRIKQDSIIVVDTIGHLRTLYSLATIVFVGKTLSGHGGQNILEPAFFGKPIIVGPNMQNFKDIMEFFLKDKAVVQVKNEAALMVRMRKLLESEAERKKFGEAAKKVIEKYQGATQKSFQTVKALLENK